MNDDNQFIDQDFISTADIFYRMVMAIAQQSIAQRLPELGEETLAALTTYRDDYHDYESTLRALPSGPWVRISERRNAPAKLPK